MHTGMTGSKGISQSGSLGASYSGSSLRSRGRWVRSYDDLINWLVENGPPGTETAELDFEGKNRVVFWRGPASISTPTPVAGDFQAKARAMEASGVAGDANANQTQTPNQTVTEPVSS